MAPRLGFLTLPGLDHFTHDIIARLGATYDVTKYEINDIRVFREAVSQSDILWFEFLWPPFLDLINTTNFGNKRVIVRLHAVEATEQDFPKHVNWAQVDDLIVVSEKMVHIVREHVPDIQTKTKVNVVFNGVETERFNVSGKHDPHQIAWVGRIIPKKDPMLALQILHKLVQKDSDFHLHFAGGFGDAIVKRYLHHMVEQLGLEPNITFHGVLDDMPQFLADQGVFLSTSISESFGYAIAEGMAAGLQTLVHSYPGVDEFWPQECVYNTVDEAVQLIEGGQLPTLKEFVEERYSLDLQIDALNELLSRETNSQKRSTHSNTRSVQFDYSGFPVSFVNLDPVDHIQRIILLTRSFYEEPMLSDMRSRLNGEGVVLDVGANIGNHTVYLAKVCQRMVHSFEPFETAANKLREQVTANGLEDSVIVHQQAVGRAVGTGKVKPHEGSNLGMTKIEVGDASGEDSVEVTCLDQIDFGAPVRMMKVDVEGMEMDVLHGATRILSEDKPLLYIEVTDDAHHAQIAGILAPFGYTSRAIFNATPTALFTVDADWNEETQSVA